MPDHTADRTMPVWYGLRMKIRTVGHLAGHPHMAPPVRAAPEAIIVVLHLIIQDHTRHQAQEAPGHTAHLPIPVAVQGHTVHRARVVRDHTALLLPRVLQADGGN